MKENKLLKIKKCFINQIKFIFYKLAINKLRKELKRIVKNNSKLNQIKIFENSLIYNKEIVINRFIDQTIKKDDNWTLRKHELSAQEINETINPQELEIIKNKLTEENNIKRKNSSFFLSNRQTIKRKSFKIKHFIKITKLEKWRKAKKENQLAFNTDYILKKFTKFDRKNKEFKILVNRLKLQEQLIKRNFIDKITYDIKSIAIEQQKNKFNNNYYDNKNCKIDWNNSKIIDILKNKDSRRNFCSELWEGSRLSDSLVVELLMRGNQVIEISYQEFETDLQDKGWEYLNNGWWKNNWKWVGTSLLAILAIATSFLIKIYWK